MRFLGVRNPFCSNILPCKMKGFLVGFAPSGVCCALASRCNARSVRLEALVGSQSILIGGGSREPLCGPSISFFLNTNIGIGGATCPHALEDASKPHSEKRIPRLVPTGETRGPGSIERFR